MFADELLTWQGRLCWTCGEDYGLVLDHEWVSGLVRGWLCTRCNLAEGRGEGEHWEAYRREPPARRLGITWDYAGERVSAVSWAEHDDLRAVALAASRDDLDALVVEVYGAGFPPADVAARMLEVGRLRVARDREAAAVMGSKLLG